MIVMTKRGWQTLQTILKNRISDEQFLKLNKQQRKEYWQDRAIRDWEDCKARKVECVMVIWDFELPEKRMGGIRLSDRWFKEVPDRI